MEPSKTSICPRIPFNGIYTKDLPTWILRMPTRRTKRWSIWTEAKSTVRKSAAHLSFLRFQRNQELCPVDRHPDVVELLDVMVGHLLAMPEEDAHRQEVAAEGHLPHRADPDQDPDRLIGKTVGAVVEAHPPRRLRAKTFLKAAFSQITIWILLMSDVFYFSPWRKKGPAGGRSWLSLSS